MSTNAIIRIETNDTNSPIQRLGVLKYWDGYPSATLPWLEEFNIGFSRTRGDDPEYKLAQLLRSSAFLADEYKLDDSKHTGWGVISSTYTTASFVYTLHIDGTVSFLNMEEQ